MQVIQTCSPSHHNTQLHFHYSYKSQFYQDLNRTFYCWILTLFKLTHLKPAFQSESYWLKIYTCGSWWSRTHLSGTLYSTNYLVVPPMGTHGYSFQVVICFLLEWSTMDLINLTAIQYVWSQILCCCRWFHFSNALDLSIVYGISSFTDTQLLSLYRLFEDKHLLGLKMDGNHWAHRTIKNSTHKRKGIFSGLLQPSSMLNQHLFYSLIMNND